MPSVTVSFSDAVYKKLQRRAKKNLLTIGEQVEDIVRRSMINYAEGVSMGGETDDKLVNIFSRKERKKKR